MTLMALEPRTSTCCNHYASVNQSLRSTDCGTFFTFPKESLMSNDNNVSAVVSRCVNMWFCVFYFHHRRWTLVMFSPRLSVSKISEKVMDGFGRNFVDRLGWVCEKDELIRFWWRSGYQNFLKVFFIFIFWWNEVRPKTIFRTLSQHCGCIMTKLGGWVCSVTRTSQFNFGSGPDADAACHWDTKCKLFSLADVCILLSVLCWFRFATDVNRQ